MMKKILSIAGIYYIIVAISACCKCPQTSKNFIYSELKAGIYSCSISDTTFQYEQLQSDSLPKNKLSIGLSLEGTVVYVMPAKNMLLFPVNTANACDCIETIFSTSDSISAIKIITLNNFDSSHAAGADVTAYFKVLDYAYSNNKTEVVQKPIDSFFQYSYSSYAPGFYLNIYLNRFPQNEGYAQFQVKVACKNGKEFEIKTKRAYLY